MDIEPEDSENQLYILFNILYKDTFMQSCTHLKGFPGGSDVKNLAAMKETWVQSHGSRRYLGEENSYSLQYSWPGEFHGQKGLVRIVHRVTKSWRRLTNTFLYTIKICRILIFFRGRTDVIFLGNFLTFKILSVKSL